VTVNSDSVTDLRSDPYLSDGVDDLHTHPGVIDLPSYTDHRKDVSDLFLIMTLTSVTVPMTPEMVPNS
jgi:hypothetical protein